MQTTTLYIVDWFEPQLGMGLTRLFTSYDEARAFANIHGGNLYEYIVLAQITDIT